MKFPDLTKVVLFTVYRPCDTEHEQENAQLYLDVLTRISHIHNNYPDMGGDFNTDLTRINSLVHSINDMHVHGTSGMDPNNLLYGRPYGGYAILYSKHLKCKCTLVDVGSSRCCAVIYVM